MISRSSGRTCGRTTAARGRALTDEQRKRRPPVVHPVFLTHPITGRKVLYANPGYTTRINELPQTESDAMLALPVRFPASAAVPPHA